MIWRCLALAPVALVAGVLGLWISDGQPPVVTIHAEPLHPIVRPGGTLEIEYHVERYRSCSSRIERILLDSRRVRTNLDDLDYAAAPGPIGRDIYIARIPIPSTFATGPAFYRIINRFVCNPVHSLRPIVTTREIAFVVRGS